MSTDEARTSGRAAATRRSASQPRLGVLLSISDSDSDSDSERPVASILRACTRAAMCGGYAASMLAGGELLLLATRERRRPALIAKLRDRACRRTLSLMGVRWTAQPTPGPSARPRLIVANHRTVLDIPVLLAAFGGIAVSRGDIAQWLVLGRLAQRAGTIFVDRRDPESGAAAIRAVHRALAAGETVTVYPEGRTCAGDQVRPFRAGAFMAARGLDVDVVPVGIATSRGIEFVRPSFIGHVADVARRPRTTVVARVGAPIRAALATDAGRQGALALAAVAQAAVQKLVLEARADPWLDGALR